tara:strand:+ start:478 stop:708 length:231 start_codon:yes stop_codon:yes gene_type:complete
MPRKPGARKPADAWRTRTLALLEERELTHRDLAEALGVTRGAATHYLNGRRDPTLKQLLEIAAWLDVSVGWLLAGE